MQAFDFGGEIVWRPSPELIAQSNQRRFLNAYKLSSLDEVKKATQNFKLQTSNSREAPNMKHQEPPSPYALPLEFGFWDLSGIWDFSGV
jgi:hypothetical protein